MQVYKVFSGLVKEYLTRWHSVCYNFYRRNGKHQFGNKNIINDKEENKMATMKNTEVTTFTLDGAIYSQNDKTGYCYRTVEYGIEGGEMHRQSVRISKNEYYKALQAHEDETDAKMREAIEHLVEEQDNEEIARIQKEMMKDKKKPSPRKKKVQTGGMGFTEGDVSATLTAKQVEFIKELPGTQSWTNSLDSTIWIGDLCDELSDKMGPMTIGAMVSTLREKNLLEVGVGQYDGGLKGKGRKSKYVAFTELGKKVVAKVLGL